MTFLRIVKLCVLASLLAGMSTAQQSTSATREAQSPPSAVIIEREYDRFTDRTDVTMKPVYITGGAGGELYLLLNTWYTGTRPPVRPARFLFVLMAASTTRVEPIDTTLLALVDGARLDLGRMRLVAETNAAPLWTLSYGVEMNYRMLMRIAGARRVELRLDNLEFALEARHRRAMREFTDAARGLRVKGRGRS